MGAVAASKAKNLGATKSWWRTISIPTVVTPHHAGVAAHPMEVMVNQRLNPIGERHVSPIRTMHISRFSGQCRRCETGEAFDRQADSTLGKGVAGRRPVATQAPDFRGKSALLAGEINLAKISSLDRLTMTRFRRTTHITCRGSTAFWHGYPRSIV